MKLVIAEKPSVAMSLAAVLGATERKDGYLEGSGYLVSWCVGHLLELAQPEAYKEQYTLREREVYLDGSHENKVWRFYQEQTNDPVLAYAISLKEVRDGKIFGDLYPLNYREHVERMKKLTCPIGNVAVAFEDGNVITIPYQERRHFMNRLMPEHGAPKTMTYLPENEPELMMILKRERFKRSYHTTAGNLEEYLDKLEKTTLREKLKKAKTAVSSQEVSSHKRGLER